MKFGFAAISVLLVGFPAFSAEVDLSFGLNTYYFDYKEDLPFRTDTQKQLKSTEAATVVAPFVKAKWALNDFKAYLIADLEGTAVSSYFDGTTLRGDPVTDTNYQIFMKGEVSIMKPLSASWYGYLGLGYSYWNRFLSGGPGYREIYTWGYFPIGVRYEIPLSKELLWSLDLSYRMMIDGKVAVIFSETVADGDDSTLKLGNRASYKFQSPFIMTLNDEWKISFAPWYEVSEIGGSNLDYNRTVGGEIQVPDSKTVRVGIALGATYHF